MKRRASMGYVASAASIMVAAAAVASGCLSPTEITIEVTTDLPCPDADGGAPLLVEVVTGDPSVLENPRAVPGPTSQACKGGRIGSIVITPTGRNDATIGIMVYVAVDKPNGTSDDCPRDFTGCIVAKRSLHFLPHENVSLPVVLRRSCESRSCEAGATCVDGGCRPYAIDPQVCATAAAGCDESKL